MATMIPESISPAAPASERQVFELLRDDTAARDWVVIHSSSHSTPSNRPREIDFLIIVPNYGIVCLEVKGGGFQVEQGQWYIGHTGSPVQSPIDQAEHAMFALKNELARNFGNDSAEGRAPTECAVVFTDTNWPDDVRPPPRQIIDHDDLHSGISLGVRLQGVMQRFRPSSRKASPFPADLANRLRQYLAPDFDMELAVAIGPTLDSIDEQLIRLTEEQYAALDLVRDNDRCLFRGAAGTGKTMLALECARRAAADGRRVGLLCFNRLLGHWLSQQVAGVDGIAAGAFWSSVMEPLILSSPAGADFQAAGRDVDERELFEKVYPEYARRALHALGPQFDALIVDEAQDLCRLPHLDLMDLALEGGLAGGRWAMFGDFTNQALFLSGSGDPEHALLQRFPYPARRNLLVNCRNTSAIARDTARITGSDLPETLLQSGNELLPQYLYWQDANELSDLLDETVHRLIAEDVHPSEIVALSAASLENTGIDTERTYGSYPLFDHSRGRRLDDADGGGTAHLRFCTVQSFKGLESPVVILIIDRLDRHFDIPNVYVGMSRGRSALTVLAHSSLRSNLDALLVR